MKPATKTLLKWVLLIVLFLSIYQFVSPATRPGPTVAAASEPFDVASLLPFASLCTVVFTAVFGYRRLLLAANAHNAAIVKASGDVAAGRFDEAERGIQGLATSRLPQFRRMFDVERAIIAMGRGDRDAALAALAHLEEPAGRLFRGQQRTAVMQGRSVRAFLRASAGDAAGAREDIAALRADPNAEPLLLARASLAEARLLDEAGDRSGLAALLERDRGLLLTATGTLERALVRAYEGMVEVSLGSVYRQKGDRAAADDATAKAAAWVAVFAPNAAPFARADLPAGAAGAIRAEVPSAEARQKVLATKPKGVRTNAKPKKATLLLWAGLVMCFLVVCTRMNGGTLPEWAAAALVSIALVALGAWIVRGFRRQTRDAKRINAAARALGRGEVPADDLALEASAAVHRAHAANVLAEAALRRGDPAAALETCERGFSALAEAQGGTLAAPAAPTGGSTPRWDLARLLAGQRAFALAALGRADEAWAEIEWANGFPNSHPVFRVRLLQCVNAEDYEAAAGAVEARDPTLALPPQDEALADIALFLGRPAARTQESAARLRAALRRYATLGPWLDAMTPKLRGAFERAAAELDAARPSREGAYAGV